MNRTRRGSTTSEREDQGKTVRVFNEVATQAAQDKVDADQGGILDLGCTPMPAGADGLAQIYNDKMNRDVLRQFDGNYLTTPGVARTGAGVRTRPAWSPASSDGQHLHGARGRRG